MIICSFSIFLEALVLLKLARLELQALNTLQADGLDSCLLVVFIAQ